MIPKADNHEEEISETADYRNPSKKKTKKNHASE